MEIVRDCSQLLIADALAVDHGHMRTFIPHDEVTSRLILRFIGHGPKDVTKGAKSNSGPAVNLQPPPQLAGFLSKRVVGCQLRPWRAVLGDENKTGMFGILGRRPVSYCFANRLDGFRPQDTTASDPVFGRE
jgi:hypothetical protein